MTSLIFEDRLEDIDLPRFLPYGGEYQCYTNRDGDVVFHGTEADFLYELEYSRNGVECIGADWWDFQQCLSDLYEQAEIIEWTSSAGDWCLAFRVGELWYPAWQENGYPQFRGYRWTISHEFPARSLEELWAILTQE